MIGTGYNIGVLLGCGIELADQRPNKEKTKRGRKRFKITQRTRNNMMFAAPGSRGEPAELPAYEISPMYDVMSDGHGTRAANP